MNCAGRAKKYNLPNTIGTGPSCRINYCGSKLTHYAGWGRGSQTWWGGSKSGILGKLSEWLFFERTSAWKHDRCSWIA